MTEFDDGSSNPNLKIILVGSGGVGKTSLVNAYFNQPFEGQTQPTVAPAFCGNTVKLNNGKVIDLHIWDTAGQERFQSIGQMFYHGSEVAFVCYDFQNINSVEDWVQRVRDQEDKCIIFLVLTKKDLLDSDKLDQVTRQGNELMEKVGAKLNIQTSASTGFGIKDLFESAANCYLEIHSVEETVQPNKPVERKDNNKNGCCK